MKKFIVLGVIVVGVLVFTNPTTADFREHVRQKQGLVGSLGIALADLFALGKSGVKRDNYWIASRFYLGGDGVLARQDLAWGVAGRFIETQK